MALGNWLLFTFTGLAWFGKSVCGYETLESRAPAHHAQLDGWGTSCSASRYHGCAVACKSLRSEYPAQVSFPDEDLYDYFLSRFWSQQQAQTFPACVFRPRTAHEVAYAVLVAQETSCPFAAKSGGHVAFSGASNIAGGITIDFAELREITVNKHRHTVSIGTGNTWFDVYSRLEKDDLVAVGGRVAPIGVGGLTTGGGISFFSNLYGWACDNVASFEVVIASGDIVTASPDTNKDLYWALRGGGNNFGLVTNFELFSYPLKDGLMWGGTFLHPFNYSESLIRACVDFGLRGAVQDPNAAFFWLAYYLQDKDSFVCATYPSYAKPLPENTHPKVFDPFYDVPGRFNDTTTTQTLADFVEVLASGSQPYGRRECSCTATFKLDARLAQDMLELWVEVVEPIKKIPGYGAGYVLQIITMPVIERTRQRGGNPLGLGDEKEPLLLVTPTARWLNAEDDEAVLGAYVRWLEKARARAKELGLDHPYVYMNYASQFQDPIKSYGKGNRARLEKISKKYDPDRVFQKLQPGYFKL